MALVDELTIHAAAGRGGNGVVRWLHLKGKEYSGPAGGNGGSGGDIYIKGVRDLGLLARYRGDKHFHADSGKDGENLGKSGRRGEDLVIDVPLGSVVVNKSTGERFETLQEGTRILILKGGRGGVGNKVFKSSVNRSPKESTPGGGGESADFFIELRLIADGGLIGLPNAGKTSLLNALTPASGKVGSYAFTTLEPNLGTLHGFVLADIPGLIEGAAQGKGLGSKFLRHIARTRLLLHCLSLESPHPMEDWQIVREELTHFEDGVLLHKKEMLIFTKSDTREPQYIEEIVRDCERKGMEATAVTILEEGSIENLKRLLTKKLTDLNPS